MLWPCNKYFLSDNQENIKRDKLAHIIHDQDTRELSGKTRIILDLHCRDFE